MKIYNQKAETAINADGDFIVKSEPKGDRILIEHKEFDENGNIILLKRYSDSGGVVDNWGFKYDAQNRCMEKFWDYDDQKREKHLYIYNDMGEKMKELWINRKSIFGDTDESQIERLFQYDEYGQLIEEVANSPENDFYDRWTYHYDLNGTLTKKVGYFKNGEPHHEHIYTYNVNQQLESHAYYRKGKLNNREIYKYENGKLISKENYIPTTEIFYSKVEYLYNSKGDLEIRYNYQYGNDKPTSVDFVEY